MNRFRGRLVRPSIVVFALLSLLLTGLAGTSPARADMMDDAAAAIDAYAADPAHSDDLGAPDGALRRVAGGAAQNFDNGTVYFSEDTGAHAVLGAIAARYRAVGGPAAVGFPTDGEQSIGDGRYSEFDAPGGAAIYWSPQTRATLLTGAVLRAWRASGGVDGPFGYPVSDTSYTGRVDESEFAGPEGTQIAWSSTAGLQTVPAELEGTLPQMTQAAQATATTEATADRAQSDNDEDGAWWQPWWQWLIVAAALLILLLVFWLIYRWGQHRKRHRAETAAFESAPAARGDRTPKAPASTGPAAAAAVPLAAVAGESDSGVEPAVEPEPEPEPEPAPVRKVLSDETAAASEIVVSYDSDSDSGVQVAYENNALGSDYSGSDDATHAWLHRVDEPETDEPETDEPETDEPETDEPGTAGEKSADEQE